jgi:hypothetical protein
MIRVVLGWPNGLHIHENQARPRPASISGIVIEAFTGDGTEARRITRPLQDRLVDRRGRYG